MLNKALFLFCTETELLAYENKEKSQLLSKSTIFLKTNLRNILLGINAQICILFRFSMILENDLL